MQRPQHQSMNDEFFQDPSSDMIQIPWLRLSVSILIWFQSWMNRLSSWLWGGDCRVCLEMLSSLYLPNRSRCCLKNSQPSNTAATCLYKPQVVICGESTSTSFFTCYKIQSIFSFSHLSVFIIVVLGERFASKELMVPTLMSAFLPSPWRATRMTKRLLLATHFKCVLPPSSPGYAASPACVII